MSFPRPAVVLITGAQAAGKSTVAQLLAEALPRSVHLRGDVFRTSIVNGREPVTADLPPAAMAQLRLRYRLATQAADTYAGAGFTVIVQDVVLGPVLDEWIGLVGTRPLLVGVLVPRPAVLSAREAQRTKNAYGTGGSGEPHSVAQLDDALRHHTPRRGLWLDSSDQAPAQTAQALLDRLPVEGVVDGTPRPL